MENFQLALKNNNKEAEQKQVSVGSIMNLKIKINTGCNFFNLTNAKNITD